MVKKSKQSTDSPDVEDASAVEDEAVPTVEDSKPATAVELVKTLVELKDRIKSAGMRPLLNVVTSYRSTVSGALEGLLDSLEDKGKKGK